MTPASPLSSQCQLAVPSLHCTNTLYSKYFLKKLAKLYTHIVRKFFFFKLIFFSIFKKIYFSIATFYGLVELLGWTRETITITNTLVHGTDKLTSEPGSVTYWQRSLVACGEVRDRLNLLRRPFAEAAAAAARSFVLPTLRHSDRSFDSHPASQPIIAPHFSPSSHSQHITHRHMTTFQHRHTKILLLFL